VELLATAFANLLDGSEVRPASPLTRAAVAFTAACLVALMCYVFPVFGASAGTLTAGALYLAAAVMLFARTHVAAPVFVPLAIAVPAGYVFALAYKLIDYKRDRGALRDILQKFVPPEVRDLLSENATQFNRIKQTVNAACVMTDIEGFTTLSTKLSSEAMLELLGEYFVAIFKPIADHGGFVVDLKGDSVLAVWTDPQSDSAVRERALRACLDLQAAVARFNREHPEARMPTRLGVNYGVVTLAPVGSLAHRIGYSAVGDTVNAGARIEELGKEVGAYVLVSASMIEGLQGFLVRDLGEFSLRGRSSPTRIFELMGDVVGAPSERLQLCDRYLSARKAFEVGDRSRAALELQLLLKDFPGDGPSKYFLQVIDRNT
jgi:adenylate cyclase